MGWKDRPPNAIPIASPNKTLLAQSTSVGSLRMGGVTKSFLAPSPSGTSLGRTLGESMSKASLFSVGSVGSDTCGATAAAPPKSAQHVSQVAATASAYDACQREASREATSQSAWVIEQVIDFGLPIAEHTNDTDGEYEAECEAMCMPYTGGLFDSCASNQNRK